MKRIRAVLVAVACATQAGCFHQVFNTGLAPSNTVITKAWHPTYVFGLIAAQPIDVRTSCPSGVAIASTRITFANGLVGGLTLGLFTPHEVKVVCASRAAMLPGMEMRHLAADASADVAKQVLAEAIEVASHGVGSVAIIFDAPSDIHSRTGEATR